MHRLPQRLELRDEAVAIWAQTELAATLSRTRSGRRAMQGWALHFNEALTRGAATKAQLEWLERQLDLAVYIVIAWTARHAEVRDFRRSGEEVEALFGHPTAADLPDYGRFPAES